MKTLIDIENEEHRRDIIQFLAQDTDYTAPSYVLASALEQLGNPIASTRLDNQLLWLSENSLVVLTLLSTSVSNVKLTRYGLDVSRGLARCNGIAKVRL